MSMAGQFCHQFVISSKSGKTPSSICLRSSAVQDPITARTKAMSSFSSVPLGKPSLCLTWARRPFTFGLVGILRKMAAIREVKRARNGESNDRDGCCAVVEL